MALTFQTLSDWLVSLGVAIPPNTDGAAAPQEGPYIPEEPDQLVIVTMLPGAGFMYEAVADWPAFQLRVRSGQDAQSTAEALAQALDLAILRAKYPVTIDGTHIQVVDRIGGAPAVLGPPDDAFRYDYVSNYQVLVGV